MKKQRILGRRLATQLTSEELSALHGGRTEVASIDTWTTSNPPDKDSTGSGGPVWT